MSRGDQPEAAAPASHSGWARHTDPRVCPGWARWPPSRRRALGEAEGTPGWDSRRAIPASRAASPSPRPVLPAAWVQAVLRGPALPTASRGRGGAGSSGPERSLPCPSLSPQPQGPVKPGKGISFPSLPTHAPTGTRGQGGRAKARPGATGMAREPGGCTTRPGFGASKSLGDPVPQRATLGARSWSQLGAGRDPAFASPGFPGTAQGAKPPAALVGLCYRRLPSTQGLPSPAPPQQGLGTSGSPL